MIKNPSQLPAGKLMPLPTPERLWSHIAVDFITDLLVSQSYTVVMIIVL